jgi:DNA-binding ferritin-like protein
MDGYVQDSTCGVVHRDLHTGASWLEQQFVERLTDDTEENIQEILTRKKGICEEIHKIQKSLNDHLDQLQETLIRSINKTVDDATLQLGDHLNNFINSCSKDNTFKIEFALAA